MWDHKLYSMHAIIRVKINKLDLYITHDHKITAFPLTEEGISGLYTWYTLQ